MRKMHWKYAMVMDILVLRSEQTSILLRTDNKEVVTSTEFAKRTKPLLILHRIFSRDSTQESLFFISPKMRHT